MTDVLVGSTKNKNHVLSKNPKTTICGLFRADGWPAPHDEGIMCASCMTRNAYVSESSRPMRNNMGGTRRP